MREENGSCRPRSKCSHQERLFWQVERVSGTKQSIFQSTTICQAFCWAWTKANDIHPPFLQSLHRLVENHGHHGPTWLCQKRNRESRTCCLIWGIQKKRRRKERESNSHLMFYPPLEISWFKILVGSWCEHLPETVKGSLSSEALPWVFSDAKHQCLVHQGTGRNSFCLEEST